MPWQNCWIYVSPYAHFVRSGLAFIPVPRGGVFARGNKITIKKSEIVSKTFFISTVLIPVFKRIEFNNF